MLDNELQMKADASRVVIIIDWLKTNSVVGISFAQFYHEVKPLIRHTFPEGEDKTEAESNRITNTLYFLFSELKNAAGDFPTGPPF